MNAVGFDLDGTLYDEFDFIAQAYKQIASLIANTARSNEEDVYEKLLIRWLEKGSSYPYIFSEILHDEGYDDIDFQLKVGECVDIFRSTNPKLSLSIRVSTLLDLFSNEYNLFLVTNGGCELQQRKIEALGLNRWFGPDQIGISRCYDGSVEKPSPLMINAIKYASHYRKSPNTIVYFGDRDMDRDFADNLGFGFVRVRQMHPVY